MSDDPIHNPIFKSLNDIARNESVTSRNAQGHIIPATVESFDGTLAVVNIEVSSENNYPQITVPLLRSEYIRFPIQKGCRGILIPLYVNIDHIIGLGLVAPTMKMGFNFQNMAFLPIASVTQPEIKNNNTLVLYGESDGVKIQTKDGSTHITVNHNTVAVTASKIELNGNVTVKNKLTVNGNVDIKGTLTVGGTEFKSHTHSNGNEGQPTGGVL